jgi:UDP-glucose 4-epimerase
MKILITGGSGFIGGRLAHHLELNGHHIRLITRNQRISDYLKNTEITNFDWSNLNEIENKCRDIDVVVHAAGMNSYDSGKDPLSALSFNGLGTANLVTGAINARVKRFIYISTAHVYSNSLIGVITEKNYLNNYHAYATSHVAGENFLIGASSEKKIEGLVIRLSNAFGTPVHAGVDCWGLLVNDLCRQSIEKKRLVLRSKGLQERNFIALKDVCLTIEALINMRDYDKSNNILNLGSINKKVIEMAKLIQQHVEELFGYSPEIETNFLKNEMIGKLKYESLGLKKYGIEVRENMIEEIEELLLFCKEHFNYKGVR